MAFGGKLLFLHGWNAKYALLLLASTIITYVCGVLIQWLNERQPDKINAKKWVVAGSFILNLAILFFFKYFNFTIESINAVLSHTSLPAVNTSLDVLLPVGISFYTFQALGYTVDVYRGGSRQNAISFGMHCLCVFSTACSRTNRAVKEFTDTVA